MILISLCFQIRAVERKIGQQRKKMGGVIESDLNQYAKMKSVRVLENRLDKVGLPRELDKAKQKKVVCFRICNPTLTSFYSEKKPYPEIFSLFQLQINIKHA